MNPEEDHLPVEVDISGPSISGFPRSEIRDFVLRSLEAIGKLVPRLPEFSEVSIAFVSDRFIRQLNRNYRGKDAPTDVLTFPAETPGGIGPLGDIVISTTTAKRQAAQQKHSTATEVRYLILHGLIHALGYDHATDEGEMDALEIEARNLVGIE